VNSEGGYFLINMGDKANFTNMRIAGFDNSRESKMFIEE